MRGQLQFQKSGTSDPYVYCGSVRIDKKRNSIIEPIEGENQAGEKAPAGYRVSVESISLDINEDLFTAESHGFRIIFPQTMQMILLNYRTYTYSRDDLLTRNQIRYHRVSLDFIIKTSELSTFDIQALPESEGGIIIEDDDIYIE